MSILSLARFVYDSVAGSGRVREMNLLVDYENLTPHMVDYVDRIMDEIKRCPSCDSRVFRPNGQAISPDGVAIKMICGSCESEHSTLVDPESFGLFMCEWSIGLMEIQNAAMESESHSGMVLEVESDDDLE